MKAEIFTYLLISFPSIQTKGTKQPSSFKNEQQVITEPTHVGAQFLITSEGSVVQWIKAITILAIDSPWICFAQQLELHRISKKQTIVIFETIFF